jgi:cold-inducible RNA-binding protein
MSNKLFVENLSFETTEKDLNDAFAAHGTVTEINLMIDRMTNRPRGFGFVTMSTAEEAQKAIQALKGKDTGGRALTVNAANSRALVEMEALSNLWAACVAGCGPGAEGPLASRMRPPIKTIRNNAPKTAPISARKEVRLIFAPQ